MNIPKARITPTTVEIFLGDLYQLDLNPPYQRGEVWSKDRQIKLICSIIKGTPIGAMHLVKYKNGDMYYVLDGKQRICALRDFKEEKFGVVWNVNGNDRILKWRSMEKSQDPAIKEILRDIKKYSFDYVTYPYMGIDDQREVFSQINYSEPLNNNEKIYCNNFHTKSLIEYIYKESLMLKNLLLNVSKEFPNNKRHDVTRLIHHILLTCFGKDFSSTDYNIVSLNKKYLMDSAKSLHNKLTKTFDTSEDEINEDTLNKLGIFKNIQIFRQVCNNMEKIINYKNSLSKKLNRVDIQDFMVFLIFKILDNEQTSQSILEKIEEYHNMFIEFSFKIYDKKSSTTKEKIKTRIGIIQKLYDENKNIDKGKKNQEFSKKDKSILMSMSDGYCPKCGVLLTDSNCHIDHVNPKSLSSKTKGQLLCSDCNRQKGYVRVAGNLF